MCILCHSTETERNNIEMLNCMACPYLTEIPYLPNLKILYCGYSRSLTKISSLPNLEELHCVLCKSLTEIPYLPNLKKLHCWGCFSLTKIHTIPEEFRCWNCPWLEQDTKYENNISKLIKVQKIVQRKLGRI